MKSKFLLLCSGAFMVLSLISCAQKSKKTDEQIRYISTTGNAVVYAQPDQADANFVVTTYDRIAVSAKEQNDQNINNMIASLKEAGVNEKDITVRDPSIAIEGGRYVVSSQVTVLIRNISKSSAIIDSAMGNGKASELKSYRHLLSDNSEVLKQVKLNAIQDAFDKAKLYATASGKSLGEVISISEFDGPAGTDDNITEAGTKLTLTATVNITYELTNE